MPDYLAARENDRAAFFSAADRGTGPEGRPGLPSWDQALGGWNGGADTTPDRVGAAEGAAARAAEVVHCSPAVKLGAAMALRAQTKARAQPWPADPLWSALAGAAGRCSGMSQACSAGRSGKRAHAADPTRGCSWNSRRTTARRPYIVSRLTRAIRPGQCLTPGGLNPASRSARIIGEELDDPESLLRR